MSSMDVHAVGSRNWSHGLKYQYLRAGGSAGFNSFTEHLRGDENHRSAAEAAAEKEIDQRIADCGDG